MEGAKVLYNTYWIRFGRGSNTFEQLVENSRTLFEVASEAGVDKIVHFSVANASSESKQPYILGKGQVEELLEDIGIPYAIIRPTLVFGEGDLLLNNMAWALWRFPVFPVFGRGDYHVQPVYAEDVAALAVDAGSRTDSCIADAAGPETFTFDELLQLLASSMGARVRLVHTPAVPGLRYDPAGRPDAARRGADPSRRASAAPPEERPTDHRRHILPAPPDHPHWRSRGRRLRHPWGRLSPYE